MELKQIVKHTLLSSVTASVIVVVILAALDIGRAYDLWVNAGWSLLAWNGAMLGPNMAKTIMSGRKDDISGS